MFFTIILWIMFALLGIYLIQIKKGPTVWDRLLGMSLITTKVTIIIIVFASLNQTSFLLDFAIVYALIGFISIIFVASFLADRKLGGKGGGSNGG